MRIYLTLNGPACIAAGIDKFGVRHADFNLQDFTEEERSVMAPLYTDGCKLTKDVTLEKGIDLTDIGVASQLINSCGWTKPYPILTDVGADSVKQAIAARVECLKIDAANEAGREAKRKADIEKDIAEVIKNGTNPKEWMEDGAWGFKVKDRVYPMGVIPSDLWQSRIYDHPAITEARKQAEQLCAERNEEKRLAKEARQAAEAQAAKEKEESGQRRATQIAEWVKANCSESDQRRFSKNLMPESEILNQIRDQVFAPAANMARYIPLKRSDLVDSIVDEDNSPYYGIDDLHFKVSTRTPGECTPETFARMETLEQLMPGATVELIEHVGYFEEKSEPDDPEVCSLGIKVTVQFGELKLSREYSE